MFWHMTDPRSDDGYGQPDNEGAMPTGRQTDNFLLAAAMLFLISVVMPVALLLGLLWHLLRAIYTTIKTRIENALSSRS